MKNHNTWLQNHKLANIKAGQVIDALDTEYVWCKAIVEMKI